MKSSRVPTGTGNSKFRYISVVGWLCLIAIASSLACTAEVVREVTVERAVKVVETVVVEKPIEIPVPQTVLVEREVTVEVPVEREVKVVETVLVRQPIEVPVLETVIVEREVEVKVVETVLVENPIEVPVPQTVIVEREVLVTVIVTPVEGEVASMLGTTPIATAVPVASKVAVEPTGGPSGVSEAAQVAIGVRRVPAVVGLPTVGPYADTPTQLGGVEEYFFHHENGNPMTPELVESWDIDPAGTRVRLTMRRGPNGDGMPFNPPLGYEDLDFGVVDADAVVRYFNESNATTNPVTTYGNSGDLANVFLEAKKIDDWTVEVGLVTPIYFCLPISQFGCLSAARGLFYLAHADSMGVEWARDHHIGTGPFVQGNCVPGHTCVTVSVDDHWRVTPSIAEFAQFQIADPTIRAALLRNEEMDLVVVDYKQVPWLVQEGFGFLETMPGGFVGQSVLFPGVLWEHSHSRTGEPLAPWACGDERSRFAYRNHCGSGPNEGPYTQDYSWIGNPWGTLDNPCKDWDAPGHERCGNAPYSDTDNPPGISDMEQARLVRLALSIAIDRNEINERLPRRQRYAHLLRVHGTRVPRLGCRPQHWLLGLARQPDRLPASRGWHDLRKR